jgi:hypothetical protein
MSGDQGVAEEVEQVEETRKEVGEGESTWK